MRLNKARLLIWGVKDQLRLLLIQNSTQYENRHTIGRS